MDDFSDIRGRLSFPGRVSRPFFVFRVVDTTLASADFATSDNACYVAFVTGQ